MVQMTIFEYTRLDKKTRAQILLSEGVFMESYTDLDKPIDLYLLSDFFVEAVLDGDKTITDTTPFMRGYRKETLRGEIGSSTAL